MPWGFRWINELPIGFFPVAPVANCPMDGEVIVR